MNPRPFSDRVAFLSSLPASVWRSWLLVSLLVCAARVAGAPPKVENIRFEQRAGTNLVDVWYDLSDPDGDSIFDVSFRVSTDGGVTWTPRAEYWTDDAGSGIRAGKGKSILWDAGQEFGLPGPAVFADDRVVIRVYASDGRSTGSAQSEPKAAPVRPDPEPGPAKPVGGSGTRPVSAPPVATSREPAEFAVFRGQVDSLRAMLTRLPVKQRFECQLDIGDLLLDKLGSYAAAESAYSGIAGEYPRHPRIPDVFYRLALALEMQEKFLEAARYYEPVATKYAKSYFGTDALDAIERCFRRNYQDRIAYVDGYPITRIEIDALIGRDPAAYEKYEAKQRLLDTLIDNRLMYAAALAANVQWDSAFVRNMREQRNRALFQEWYEREVNGKVPSQLAADQRQQKTSQLYEQAIADLKRQATITSDPTAIERDEETLAVVNGVAIDKAALELRLNAIPPFYRSQFDTPEGKRRILDNLVLEMLLLKEVERTKLWLSNKVMDQVLARRSTLLIDTYKRMMTTDLVVAGDDSQRQQKEKVLYDNLIEQLRSSATVEVLMKESDFVTEPSDGR
jgi:hypothetical protein